MKILTLKFAFLLSFITLSGCHTPQTTTQVATNESAVVADELPINQIPVIRHGRFTLVEVNSQGNVQNLLSQIIEISMPLSVTKQKLTVTDGLDYVLLGSGYQLCQSDAINLFSKLPLPASHYHLGPVTLMSALQTIAGSTWQMQVDQHNRMICFISNPEIPATVDIIKNNGGQSK